MTALEGAPHGVTSNCINPSYVRTPLVEKQIADQAKVHGIPEDEVVEKIMLTETAIKRLVEAGRGRVARGLARLGQGRHGHRRLVHDGRRMDGAMSRYRTVDVAVAGGDAARRRVGSGRRSDDAPAVLLIHGVTASHLSWPLVAERLPDVRVIAPDLRGRGRSNGLAGPAGLAAHARDLVAVLDALGVERARRRRALDGRVRRARARRPVPGARVAAGARRRRAAARRARRGSPPTR